MPPLMMAKDALFVLVFLTALILHLTKSCIKWEEVKDASTLPTAEQIKAKTLENKKLLNERQSKRFLIYSSFLLLMVLG